MAIPNFRKAKINRRYHGYSRIPKSIYELICGVNALSDSEFVLYQFIYSVLAEFDKKRPLELGTFQYINSEIAYALGWSDSKVSRNLKTIKEKGYIFKNVDGLYEVTGYRLAQRILLSSKSKTITLKNVIDYAKNNKDLLRNEITDADLQDFEMSIYLESVDLAEPLETSQPP